MSEPVSTEPSLWIRFLCESSMCGRMNHQRVPAYPTELRIQGECTACGSTRETGWQADPAAAHLPERYSEGPYAWLCTSCGTEHVGWTAVSAEFVRLTSSCRKCGQEHEVVGPRAGLDAPPKA